MNIGYKIRVVNINLNVRFSPINVYLKTNTIILRL